MRILFCCLFLFVFSKLSAQPAPENPVLKKGWEALIKDNDTEAFRIFWSGYEQAKKSQSVTDQAEALLYLGICSFGSNLEKGLQYATKSLELYEKLKASEPGLARIGRSKCLQLISTIYTRQGKFDLAENMSREVVQTLFGSGDKTGTLGLAYTTLAGLQSRKEQKDSAIYFQRLGLADFEKSGSFAYLPGAYVRIGQMENKPDYYSKALAIADSTENKQAQVSALLAMGKWQVENNDPLSGEKLFLKAEKIALALTDKTFEIRVLESLTNLRKRQKNYQAVSELQQRLIGIKDSYYSLEREQMMKNLEVQFEVSEKNRALELMAKESEVTKLTNIILTIFAILLLIVAISGFLFFKSIRKRDRQLIQTKEELVDALEKQRQLEESQFRHDLQHNESQLNAITVQMLQKNELIDEIKSAVENQQTLSGTQLLKIVNKHLTHEQNWNDFDLYFETLNKNFYQRLKHRYPDISANDLKICALIKLNLSIKEMASILNISPDSVKTARYRLRKKLQLHTEENLTDFILSV